MKKVFLVCAALLALGAMTACKRGTADKAISDTTDSTTVSFKVTTALPTVKTYRDIDNEEECECIFRDDLEGIATQVAFVDRMFDFDPDTLPEDDERVELYDDFATYANDGAKYLVEHGIEFELVKPNTRFVANGRSYELPNAKDGVFVFYLTNSATSTKQLFMYEGLSVGYEMKIDENGEWHFDYEGLQTPLREIE